MKLPNHQTAVVPKAKITDYLLSVEHRDGRGKALFFTRFGFSVGDWQALAAALLEHAADHQVTRANKRPLEFAISLKDRSRRPMEERP